MPEKQIFVSYDDPESLALKCKYVLANKLSGIMFWDYESDHTGALLDAVNDGLNKKASPARRNQMTTTATAKSVSVLRPAASARLASIDIFRGLTMTLMIYVNEQSEVKGLPWWNYHMKANVDAMTYVDMVFPFFLFIIGLSLPIAIASRLKRNPSLPALWMHVALRTASLMVLGLILANADDGDASRMIIRPARVGHPRARRACSLPERLWQIQQPRQTAITGCGSSALRW